LAQNFPQLAKSTDSVQSTFNAANGNNRIKVVAGENTKFDIDIYISKGEFKELGA